MSGSPYSDYSDADQAALMDATLRLLFSHPAVKGITLWGFWEGNIWIPNSGEHDYFGVARVAGGTAAP